MIARLNLIVVNVSLAALAVAVFQWILGFPPLILFIVPVAIVFRISGFAAGLTAAVIGAVVGDYFFCRRSATSRCTPKACDCC
jgi:hypothetical protein